MRKILNLHRTMATILTSREIKTFVFLDTETTGLPYYENNTTKITELCLTAVHASHIELGVFPRVQNKLNLCFNPAKLICPDAERITGLSNNLLEESYRFTEDTVVSINHFLNHSPKPICFVAHNGLKFDYPLLRKEIVKTNMTLTEDVLCIDSLILFKELLPVEETCTETKAMDIDHVDNVQKNVPLEFTPLYDQMLFSLEAQERNETTPIKQIIRDEHNYPLPKKLKVMPARKHLNFGTSYKLGDIFSRLTKKDPISSHQADGDVQMLIMCAATLGDKFVDWCNKNVQKFCDIPIMVSGKRIGT